MHRLSGALAPIAVEAIVEDGDFLPLYKSDNGALFTALQKTACEIMLKGIAGWASNLVRKEH